MMDKELPDGWENVKIGNVYYFSGGGTPSKTVSSYWNGNLPWASIKDISRVEVLESTQDFITESGLKNSASNLAQIDEIIIGTRMSPGKPVITKIVTAINQDLKIVRSNLPIPSRYTYYLFRSLEKEFESRSAGTTVKGIRLEAINDISFSLPPLAEQKRIVAKLDMAFGYLETLKASLARIPELLKTFRQSVLTQAVTGKLTSRDLYKSMGTYKEWQLIEGNDIFDFVTSGSRGWADYYADSGKLFLRMTNLNYDTIEIDASIAKNRYVNLPNRIEGLRTKVQPNDILISITAEVGMIGIIPEGFEEAYVNQHIALARPNKRYYPKYLAYFLASKGGGQDQFNKAKKGATKSGLGLDDIRNLKINTPSLDEQFLIVEKIECLFAKADAIEAQYLSLKEKINKLPQALLAKAFRGELVPQDPADEPASVLLEKIQNEIGKLSKKGKKQMELVFED